MDRLTRLLDGIEDRWPTLSRLVGFAVLLYTALVAAPADKPIYIAVVLVLLSAPTVTGVQDRRNRRRDEDDG